MVLLNLCRMYTGVNLNLTVVHPLTGKVVPVVVADYVVNSYGTHAVMGVAAHDARDRELASHLHLPVWSVLDEDGRLMHSEQVGTRNSLKNFFSNARAYQ